MKYRIHNLDNIIRAIEEYENTGSTCMDVCGKYDIEKNIFFYYLRKYRMENNASLTNHQLGGGKIRINKKNVANKKISQIVSCGGGNVNSPTINDILNNNIPISSNQKNNEVTKYKEIILPNNTPTQRKVIADAKRIPLEIYEESLRERESEMKEEKKKLRNKKNTQTEEIKKHKEKEIVSMSELNQFRLTRPELGIF